MAQHFVFDIDGTLLNEEVVLLAQAKAVESFYGADYQAIITAFFLANQKAELLKQSGQLEFKNNLQWYFTEMTTTLGVTLSPEDIVLATNAWVEAHATAQANPIIFSDVPETIRSLKAQGHTIHIASGSNLENRTALLQTLGISDCIDTIFAAETVGYQKQHVTFWHLVVQQIGVPPSEITVIGNQLNDDILHPKALGMNAILIDRKCSLLKPYASISVVPDSVITSLYELLPAGKNLPSVCFVIQRVTPGTHMDYVLEMATALRQEKQLPVTVLIEKPTPELKTQPWWLQQRYPAGIFRIVENFFLLARERWRGTKIFYIHYSFVSAISAGVITKLTGGQVYYWNAGMPWLYHRSFFTDSYQRLAYRLIDFLVTGAEALVEGYCKTYGLLPSHVAVIPNWIDLTRIDRNDAARGEVRSALDIPFNAPVILFVHKLAKRKGAHHLIEIFSLVKNQECHLIIAGDGPERVALTEQAERLGLVNRVHFLGQVPRATVVRLYQTADLFLMPSEEEGSPHSLIEAMAYELPFIATNVGGVPETVPEVTQRFLYNFADVTGMASGVDHLLAAPEEQYAIKAAMRDWIERFSKTTAVNRFYSLLVVK